MKPINKTVRVPRVEGRELIEARIPGDICKVYYPSHREANFLKHLQYHRPEATLEPVAEWEWLGKAGPSPGKVPPMYYWTKKAGTGDGTLAVMCDVFLGYSMEYFSFTEDRIRGGIKSSLGDPAEVQALLEAAPFQDAKSEYNPHQYVLLKNWDKDTLHQVAMYLNKHGKIEPFGNRFYQVCVLGKFRYWTMSAPLSVTTLINRTPVRRSFKT